MINSKKQSVTENTITYHYPFIDLEKKKVEAKVTVDQQMYLSVAVDLSNGVIQIEKNAADFKLALTDDQKIIEQIKTMAEFMIFNQIDSYSKTFLS